MNDPKPLSIPTEQSGTYEAAGDCQQHGPWQGAVRVGREGRCPDCLMAEIREKNDREHRDSSESQASAKSRALGIPGRYGSAAMAEVPSEVRAKLTTWAKSCSHSLVITGPVGVGKTYTAAALALHCHEQKFHTRYASQASILRAIRSTWGQRSEKSEDSVWRELTTPAVLIVDDVGAARGNENDLLRIAELIDERYNEQRPTVIVTNLKPDQLKAELGDRAYDRICEGGQLIVMGGESRRRKA